MIIIHGMNNMLPRFVTPNLQARLLIMPAVVTGAQKDWRRYSHRCPLAVLGVKLLDSAQIIDRRKPLMLEVTDLLPGIFLPVKGLRKD